MYMTGAVLAGGKSKRFGENKAFCRVFGQFVIKRVLDDLSGVTEEIFIIANDRGPYSGLGVQVYPDLFPGYGPLAGLHSALVHATHGQVFLVACDMPFLEPDFMAYMKGLSKTNNSVIPYSSRGPEPLLAIYHRSCLPLVEERLKEKRLSMKNFIEDIPHYKLVLEHLSSAPCLELSISNINTKKDLEKALRLYDKCRADKKRT